MTEIIEITEMLERRRSRRQYARLRTITGEWEAEVGRNPWPTIDAMANHIRELRDRLEAVDQALNPEAAWIQPGVPVGDGRQNDMRILVAARNAIAGWRP